jgi:hypothetical protein
MTNSYQYQHQLTQDRFGLQVAARLSDAADQLPYDISERLRAARTRALGQRKVAAVRTVGSLAASGANGTMTLGHPGWWDRAAAAVPLLALVFGLIAINMVQNENRANELAEIDAALLTDDLPPAAYADPAFAQFLKSSAGQNQ